MPRSCTICPDKNAKRINCLIGEGVAYRAISRQIFGSEKKRSAIQRHSENCLQHNSSAVIAKLKVEASKGYYAEIDEQLNFARNLRIASQNYLTDPITGEITLFPRADEIQVVYYDPLDTNKNGEPKKKRNDLQYVIDHFRVKADKTVVKHVDIRSFALDCIKTADIVLDKIAKREGLYQEKQSNKFDKLYESAVAFAEIDAKVNGTSVGKSLKVLMDLPDTEPELRAKLAAHPLVSDSVN